MTDFNGEQLYEVVALSTAPLFISMYWTVAKNPPPVDVSGTYNPSVVGEKGWMLLSDAEAAEAAGQVLILINHTPYEVSQAINGNGPVEPPYDGPPIVEIVIDPDNAAGTDYTSLQAALVAEAKDITEATGSNEAYKFRCRSSGTHDNTGDINIDFEGWNTYRPNRNIITIEPYDASQRAGTQWDESKYILACNSTDPNGKIVLSGRASADFKQIQIEKDNPSDQELFFISDVTVPGEYSTIDQCYLRVEPTASAEYAFSALIESPHYIYVRNCIIDAFKGLINSWWEGKEIHGAFYSNTIVNCTEYGIRYVENAANTSYMKIRNNLIDGAPTCYDCAAAAEDHSGNSTSDASSPDGLSNQTNSFTSATNYQITSGDDAYQAGADLSADLDYPFDVDIIDNDRPTLWSVGASDVD